MKIEIWEKAWDGVLSINFCFDLGLEIIFMDCEETIKRENRDAVRGGCRVWFRL
jgi:hypothetical protein